ncbi:MAG: biotin transporter BioY [Clostridia bacterium]|nr:biotin transporter BioY [Clostridia bacterium]
MKRIKTLDICLCGVFAALSAIGAFIRIPIPICPFTLQLTFTTLAGLLLGKRRGALSVAIYVIVGLLGIPVFTEGGGIYYVLKPTFGELIGFIAATYVTGASAWSGNTPSYPRIFLASVAGVVTDYLFGMVYMYIICNYVIDAAIGFKTAFVTCFLLLLPKDIILAALSSVLAMRLMPIFQRILQRS